MAIETAKMLIEQDLSSRNGDLSIKNCDVATQKVLNMVTCSSSFQNESVQYIQKEK